MNSRNAESRSQTAKAVKLRNERSNIRSERMFNAPLRAFLEHKYPDIYCEYVSLYNEMRNQHPGRKKLITSETFRKWKTNNPKPSAVVIPQPREDILTLAMRETFTETQNDQEIDENMQLAQIDSEAVQNIPDQAQEDIEYKQLSAEIDGIINELMVNEAVREVLEPLDPLRMKESASTHLTKYSATLRH